MPADPTAHLLLRLCQDELQRIIKEMESAPSRTAFFDVGAVGEILVLASNIPEGEILRHLLADAASRWLKTGFLEDLLIARVEFTYHIALLCYLAETSTSWSQSDFEIIASLTDGRLVGRNEMPVVRQLLTDCYFSHGRVQASYGYLGGRSLAQFIDTRGVRARLSDEFDLLELIMCAQLMQIDRIFAQQMPRSYPQAQLVQAIRDRNENWLPVLTFLCWRYFGLPRQLLAAVFSSLREFVPSEGQLLPPPLAGQTDTERIERSERGLRLRSTIALTLLLTSLGEFHGN
jgi:hypothetical protein